MKGWTIVSFPLFFFFRSWRIRSISKISGNREDFVVVVDDKAIV